MVDRVDDFVTRDTYEAQRLALQALLETERDYRLVRQVKLRLFVRADLMKRMNLAELGADKLSARTIELAWSHADIRRLLAQRITYNLLRTLRLRSLEARVGDRSAFVDATSAKIAEPSQPSHSRMRRVLGTIGNVLRFHHDRNAERTSFTDELNKDILLSIFPPTIHVENSNVDLFRFLEYWFRDATGRTTPRIMLRFLKLCVDHMQEFYRDNAQRSVTRSPDHTYRLIDSRAVTRAREELRAELWQVVSTVDTQWRAWCDRLRESRRNSFTFAHLGAITGGTDQAELTRFAVFLEHLGVICIRDIGDRIDERRFELGEVFT
jgi:hypothetical protein